MGEHFINWGIQMEIIADIPSETWQKENGMKYIAFRKKEVTDLVFYIQ